MKAWMAMALGPTLYLAGAVTMRLCETKRVDLGVVVFGLAVGMCSLMVLLTEE